MSNVAISGALALLLLASCNDAKSPETPTQGDIQIVRLRAPNDASGPSPDKLDDALMKKRKELDKCYAEGLTREPKLTGTINALFKISRDGSVSEATDAFGGKEPGAAVALPDTEVARCVLGVIQLTNFGKRPQEGEAVYSLKFVPLDR